MHSINENEINRLKVWAAEENNCKYFDKNSSYNGDSFWVDRKQDATYIKEYNFTNVPEFEALCADILGHELDGRIKTVVAVAIMKNTPREAVIKEKTRNGEMLPEYIYVF